MSRTAPPRTPGTNPPPTPDNDATVDALAQDTLQAGALAAAATSEAEEQKSGNAELHAELAKRDAELAELRAMVHALGRNQIAQAVPERVKLPTMAETVKKTPSVPVLTEEGWFVPPTLPNDRKL